MSKNKIRAMHQHGYDVLERKGCTNIEWYFYGLGFGFTFEYQGKKYKAHYADEFYGSKIYKWTVMMLDGDSTYFAEPFYVSHRKELEKELNRKEEVVYD